MRRILTLGPVTQLDDVRRALGQVETAVNKLSDVEAADLPEKVAALEATDTQTAATLDEIDAAIALVNTQILQLQSSLSSLLATITAQQSVESNNVPNTAVGRDGTGSFKAQDIDLDGDITLVTGDVKATAGDVLALAGDVKSETGQFSKSFGYVTGAGGTVTQLTSKSTGVTLDKICGEITMHAASLASLAGVSFVLSNNKILAGDVLIINHVQAGIGFYVVEAVASAGAASITIYNVDVAARTDAVKLRFAVVRSVNA